MRRAWTSGRRPSARRSESSPGPTAIRCLARLCRTAGGICWHGLRTPRTSSRADDLPGERDQGVAMPIGTAARVALAGAIAWLMVGLPRAGSEVPDQTVYTY